MTYKAPNGFIYSNKKAYLRSLRAMNYYSSSKKPIISSKKNKQTKRTRQSVRLNKVKYIKKLDNHVGTASNSEDFKVVQSTDEREARRKFQSNVIQIEDDDANVRIDIIDRENKLKPKRAKNIITEDWHGDKVITEYDNKGGKVAEMHVQVSNLRPIDTERTPKQLKRLTQDFENKLQNLSVPQLKGEYSVAQLRVLAPSYNVVTLEKDENGKEVLKGEPRVKDLKLWYIRNIRAVILSRQMNEGN